jgi:DNA-binding transcriptional LysR family regulator
LAAPSDIVLERVLAHCSLRHVQGLLMLAETGSVQGTAQAIGIPPSSLEQVVSQLDEMFEAELFRREGNALQPTPACVALLPHAREVMRAVAGGTDAVVVRSRPDKIPVRVLAAGAAARQLLARAVPSFQARYARIDVQWGESEDSGAAIERAEVDLVVGARPALVPHGWDFRELLAERFSVVCSPAHPLAWQTKPSWGQLSRHAWLLSEKGSPARHRFDALLAQRGIGRVNFCVVTSVDDLADWLLRDPEMVAFAPTALLHRQLVAGELVRLRAEGLGANAIGLLQPHDAGAAVRRLADFLQHFAALPQEQPAWTGFRDSLRNAPTESADRAMPQPREASL